ncbi:MAG TPA: hypothetical protein DHV35_09015, partial [Halieaceae bacterium]|nr:hypothetical protein [Halieaceae bacterium]
EFEATNALVEALARGETPARLPADIDPSLPVAELIRSLVDQYGTGRVLFRNTRKSVTGFPSRELHRYTLPEEALIDQGGA